MAQKVHRKCRNQCSRKNVRRDHRKDDRLCKWRKQVFRDAAQKEHGQKDDADAERGDQRGNGNLRCAIENRFQQRIAVFQVALNVFERDGSVIHKDADGECKPAERHRIDRLAKEAKHQDRSKDRQRNGNGNNQRGAPAAEKQQDHDAGESRGNDGFSNHT